GGLMVEWRSELVPLLPLHEVLQAEDPREMQPLVMIVRSGAERLAISVERILGEVELVVRPLERPLRGTRRLAGAGVLPSGELALVLNVAALVRWRHERRPSSSWREGRKPAAAVPAGRRALVVDDSVVFRSLLGDLLTGLGFIVSVAEDGHHALELLTTLAP